MEKERVRSQLLVVIPAYNEEMNIRNVIDDLRKYCPEFDYLIINDGSTDDTLEVCRQNGYNVLDLSINLGISGGIDPGISRDMDLYFEKTEKSAGRDPRHHFLDLFFCHSDPDQSVSADRGLAFRAAGHLFHGQHGLFDHYFCPSAAGVSAYHQVFPDGPSDQNSGGGAGAS